MPYTSYFIVDYYTSYFIVDYSEEEMPATGQLFPGITC